MDERLNELRDENLRQIDVTVDLLEDIRAARSGTHRNTPLMRDSELNVARHLDTARIGRVQRMLADERIKVERFEYWIMFTGTVKAGKTTSINAIVGMDVLPSRAEPMTTLPTLIKHSPGVKEPRLLLEQADRVNAMLASMRGLDLDTAGMRSGVKATYELIRRGAAALPRSPIEGRHAVRETLLLLNDALRVAELAGRGDELMSAFETASDLPTVEIEFLSVGGLVQASEQGRLVLVDSPGPNEAAHSARLVAIVEEQLDRSSALVVVANFTVLGSEDEDEMRSIVRAYVEARKGRENLMLLNRYDSAVASDRGPKALIQDMVTACPQFDRNRIFPVAAVKALLATCAKREFLQDRLPTDGLRIDFAKHAFGDLYREGNPRYKDIGLWREASDGVWEQSFFDTIPPERDEADGWPRMPAPGESTPLSCMRDAAQRAAESAIGSGLRSVQSELDNMDVFLSIRGKLNDDEIDGLVSNKASLDKDLQDVAEARRKVDAEVARHVTGLNAGLRVLDAELLEFVKGQIARAFGDAAPKEPEPKKGGLLKRGLRKLGSLFTGEADDGSEDKQQLLKDLDLSGIPGIGGAGSITVSTQAEATALQEKIEQAVTAFTSETCDVCETAISEAVLAIEVKVQRSIDQELKPILDKAKVRLGKEFDSDFELAGNVDLEGVKSHGTGARSRGTQVREDRIRLVERAGRVAKVQRFFGSMFGKEDWGHDGVSYTVRWVELDIAELLQLHLERVEKFTARLKESVQAFVGDQIVGKVDTYSKALSEFLEEYRNTINDTLGDHDLSVEERAFLRKRVLQLRERVRQVLEDVKVARRQLREIEGAEGALV